MRHSFDIGLERRSRRILGLVDRLSVNIVTVFGLITWGRVVIISVELSSSYNKENISHDYEVSSLRKLRVSEVYPFFLLKFSVLPPFLIDALFLRD